MFYYLSKIVGFVATPLGVALVMLVAALVMKRAWAKNTLLALLLVWCWVTGCPWVVGKMALHLEKDFQPVQLDKMPEVDMIHVLGGGVGPSGPTNEFGVVESDDPYNLGPAADRVTMGARVWKQLGGRAQIILTGPCCGKSSLPFLLELGVTTNDIRVCEEPRTTEEEARLMSELVAGSKLLVASGEKVASGRKMRVAVVTTAIHMRRAMMLYGKFAPEVEAIPVATDYMILPYVNEPFKPMILLPNIDAMNQFNSVLHEYLGYWARCWK